jgi:prephenate dehydrogenase
LKKTVAIIGLGLIGGSLGMALRRSGRYRVIGISRRPATLHDAKRLGAADTVTTQFSALSDADIVVLATPVALLLATLRRALPHLKRGAIVTDVGSVKTRFVKDVERLIRGSSIRFVSGHPMAGSHKSGVRAARANLFQGATCALLPVRGAPTAALAALWSAVGARPQVMKPKAHDEAVALTSHLPHVLAHALAQAAAARSDQKTLKAMMAGSFRDVTRVASSDPEQWAQIFTGNAPALKRTLKAFSGELARLTRLIGKPGMVKHLRKSQAYRLPLFNGL